MGTKKKQEIKIPNEVTIFGVTRKLLKSNEPCGIDYLIRCKRKDILTGRTISGLFFAKYDDGDRIDNWITFMGYGETIEESLKYLEINTDRWFRNLGIFIGYEIEG
jgi:hypothetical protein